MEPRNITHLGIDYSRTQLTNPRNGLKQLYSRVIPHTLPDSLADLHYLIIEQGDDLQTLINRLSCDIRQTQLPDLQPGLGRGYVEDPEVNPVLEQQMTDAILVRDHTLDQVITLSNQSRSRRIFAGGTQDSGRKLVRRSSASMRESYLSVLDFDSAITRTLYGVATWTEPAYGSNWSSNHR